MIRLILCCLALGACTTFSPAVSSDSEPLSWLTGCWLSEDGSTREVWSASEGRYYFGYSAVFNDGETVFFEQMRIDPGDVPTFNAYPRGEGPSAFPAIEMGDGFVTFANPAHDYPQKIKYWRDGDDLKAAISLIDDERLGTFDFRPCPADRQVS